MGTMLEQGDAYMNLTRAAVESDGDVALPDLAARAKARIKELEMQQDQFLDISIPADDVFSADSLPSSLKATLLADEDMHGWVHFSDLVRWAVQRGAVGVARMAGQKAPFEPDQLLASFWWSAKEKRLDIKCPHQAWGC
eukprot:1161045-Pelagomonas_calceolata.AAC.21